jgi:hypothetical protein
LMDRNFNTINNGTVPATNSGVFIEYYAVKGIALHPRTPDVLYAMTYARSSSGSGWDVEPGYIIRYQLEGDFTSTKTIPASTAVTVFPNPFRDKITFTLGQASDHSILRIYDLYGRLIVEEPLDRLGTYTWHGKNGNGTEVPPGLYIYRLGDSMKINGSMLKIK